MAESEEYRRGLNLAGRRAWNDGYTAGLLAGLKWAQDGLASWGPAPDYYPEIWEPLEDAIDEVERTGELPEEEA
jgi:hypothetical protein